MKAQVITLATYRLAWVVMSEGAYMVAEDGAGLRAVSAAEPCVLALAKLGSINALRQCADQEQHKDENDDSSLNHSCSGLEQVVILPALQRVQLPEGAHHNDERKIAQPAQLP
jgi:hypothetical protein